MATRKNYINRIHIMIEIVALAFWIASMAIAIIGTMTLEGQVPTHFNGRGIADGFGEPKSLLVMPVVMMVLMGPMSLLCHHFNPRMWNIPFNVKPERIDLVYTDITYMVLILELIISIICLWMTIAGFRQGNVGIAFTVLGLGAVALDLIVWLIIAVRHNRM